MALVKQAGFVAPNFDYASVKVMQQTAGYSKVGPNIASTLRALSAAGIPAPLWSIADEPADGDAGLADLKSVRDAIKASAADAQISASSIPRSRRRSFRVQHGAGE